MNITCQNCNSKFKIDAGKIPAGKNASLQCPRCGHKILVKSSQTPVASTVSESPPHNGEGITASTVPDSGLSDHHDTADFDLHEGKTVLICENDPTLKTKIQETLEAMKYRSYLCHTTRDAIKKMRFNSYDMIIVDERFDTNPPEPNGVQIYIEQLETSRRRDTYAVLISQKFQTMNRMIAYNRSFNMIVNPSHIDNLKMILEKGIEKHEAFYKLFRESLKRRAINFNRFVTRV